MLETIHQWQAAHLVHRQVLETFKFFYFDIFRHVINVVRAIKCHKLKNRKIREKQKKSFGGCARQIVSKISKIVDTDLWTTSRVLATGNKIGTRLWRQDCTFGCNVKKVGCGQVQWNCIEFSL